MAISPSGPPDHAEPGVFNFENHRKTAEAWYDPLRGYSEARAAAAQWVLEQALGIEALRPLSITSRAKDLASFGEKAARPDKADPNQPRYPEPRTEVTDLAGARVIVYLLSEVEQVSTVIEREFIVVEKQSIEGLVADRERVGYQSVHFLAQFSPVRHALLVEQFSNDLVEIQVRTVLQHAWAEVEHGVQYKSGSALSTDLQRRFISLAGLIEIADREFQAISRASPPPQV
jgi:putative GTP pyrophosphokinase